MFDFPEVKMFMDSVHGYIMVPKPFVKHLIDTEMFQRLRNIDQTGMKMLFPNAKHDRFSHSLGVYYLGYKAVDTLLYNFSHEDYWKISSDSKSIIFWAKNKVLFLIACLLHDIGHTPFSHALEKIVLDGSRNVVKVDGLPTETRLVDRLIKEIAKLEGENAEKIKKIDVAPHEIIGSMYIVEHLQNAIEQVFDDLIVEEYPLSNSNNILYAEHYSYNPIIDKDELSSDIAFIVRMILGLKYTSYFPENQIRNCFIELLNSGNFDVDKLDYIIRDTKMSGISNISIDIERLLSSLCIVTKTKYTTYVFSKEDLKKRVVLKLIGSDKDSGFHIKGRFRGTILLGKNADVTIFKGSTFISLSSIEQGQIKYTPSSEAAKFSKNTVLIQNGHEILNISEKDNSKRSDYCDQNPFDFNISNAEVTSDDFHFIAVTKSEWTDVAELQVNGYCDIIIKGKFGIKSSATFFETSLDGCVDEFILLGNMIKHTLSNESIYNEFSVGFKKQAINVIANVIEARDYLYLWIYAHPKVMYYANFLIPLISREILINENLNKFPVWNLKYENIEYLDDNYVWTAIKYYNFINKDTEWHDLCKQLLERKYRTSLYKSLAEFDLLFEAIPINKRQSIKSFLLKKLSNNFPRLDDEGAEAGYLCDEFVNELKSSASGKLDNIVDIIYLDAGYKMKRFNVYETFILTSDGMVASVDEIPLLTGRVASALDTSYYFYLYYKTNTVDVKECKEEIAILKDIIRNYFTDLYGNTYA